MQFWTIEDGERCGPFQAHEIRVRLERGELSQDDHIWHESLSEWQPICQLELFRNTEIQEASTSPPPLPEMPTVVGVKQPLFLVRRFFARWLDLFIYSALWWFIAYLLGADIKVMSESLWLQLGKYLPWFLIEAYLIHRWGITPGKWLLGIRVINDDQSRLVLSQAVARSLRVYVMGIGFGWPLINVLCQAIAWFTTMKAGKSLWDFSGHHQVVASKMKVWRIVLLAMLFFASMQLETAVVGPYLEEQLVDAFPVFQEMLEEGNYWKLPRKD